MTNHARVTEILGLPGAGKSTVERAAAAHGIPTLTRWPGPSVQPRIPVAVQFFVRAPVLSLAAFLAVLTRRSVTGVHLRRVLSVQRRHIMTRDRRSLGESCVLDEGPLHALFITLYATQPTALSRPLLRLVVRLLARDIARFVYLDIGTERCIANFRRPGRTSFRFNELSSETTIEEFRNDSAYAEVIGALRRVAAAKLVVVGSVDEACAAIDIVAITQPESQPRPPA